MSAVNCSLAAAAAAAAVMTTVIIIWDAARGADVFTAAAATDASIGSAIAAAPYRTANAAGQAATIFTDKIVIKMGAFKPPFSICD